MKEIEKKSSEYHLPFEIKPGYQVFTFSGFLKEQNRLFFDLRFEGCSRMQGMILRTNITDAHSYKKVNEVIWTDEPHYANPPTEYDKTFYNPDSIELWRKQLSLEQVSIFADLVSQMAQEEGLENLSQKDIFSNEDVRNILGLDLDDPFDYTPVKKTSDDQIPELA